MDGLGEGIRKILLAGIGAVAVTGEKSKEVLEELVKKGELTVEQGKALNEELKHTIKKKVKENVNVSVKTSSPEELDELLEKMTPEQVNQLKQRIASGGGKTERRYERTSGNKRAGKESGRESGRGSLLMQMPPMRRNERNDEGKRIAGL